MKAKNILRSLAVGGQVSVAACVPDKTDSTGVNTNTNTSTSSQETYLGKLDYQEQTIKGDD